MLVLVDGQGRGSPGSSPASLSSIMVDKGPLLTSAIIFYLSIGAAIFQVLEEPNWKLAVNQYDDKKEKILKDYPCLSKADLNRILEVGAPLHLHTDFALQCLSLPLSLSHLWSTHMCSHVGCCSHQCVNK